MCLKAEFNFCSLSVSDPKENIFKNFHLFNTREESISRKKITTKLHKNPMKGKIKGQERNDN